MSIELMMPTNHIVLCCHLLLLPSIFPSIRILSESVLHIRWPKYWSLSFSISPSNEYSGLISFRMDWLDLLAVQGTLKSLLQYHSSKASILWCSAFFIVQLSHPYVTTGKTIAFTRWTFDGKVMSLLLNMLSRFVTAFLLRSKRLLILWLQSPSVDGWIASPTQWTWAWASLGTWWWTGKLGMLQSMGSQRVRHDWATELNWVTICSDFGAPQNKVTVTVSIVSPSICHEVMDWMPWSSFFENWVLSQLFHSPLSLSSRGTQLYFGDICIHFY